MQGNSIYKVIKKTSKYNYCSTDGTVFRTILSPKMSLPCTILGLYPFLNFKGAVLLLLRTKLQITVGHWTRKDLPM